MASCTPYQLASCPFCEYHVCKTCAKKWLLSTNEDPNCMNCHKPFPIQSMIDMFGASFVKSEWKRHRENVLLDRETAMLPETQPFVEAAVQQRENTKRTLELQDKKANLKRQMREIDQQIYELHNNNNNNRPEQDATARRDFVQRCTHENCDGFLSQQWKCRKCEKYTCNECGAPKNDGHVCKEEDRASLNLIRQDSRKCVRCGAWTYKIHGCNQMYCTAPGCNTAWDWRTGRIVTGQIHNPEYFRMRRELGDGNLGRNPNDIPCGGVPSDRELSNAFPGARSEDYMKMSGLLRLIHHVNVLELPQYPDRLGVEDNRELRISFMLSEITADQMKIKLQQREKKMNKQRDIHHLLEMVVTTIGDIMRQIIIDKTTYSSNFATIERIIDYYNFELRKVCIRYQCVGPSIYRTTSKDPWWYVRTTAFPTSIWLRR
tara:strand:+ start:2838 stop:4133 length:1296 start_codon:yes stop_codon:yes gene_type:complete